MVIFFTMLSIFCTDQSIIILSWNGRPFDGYSDLVAFSVQVGEYNDYALDVEWHSPVNVSAPTSTYSFRFGYSFPFKYAKH